MEICESHGAQQSLKALNGEACVGNDSDEAETTAETVAVANKDPKCESGENGESAESASAKEPCAWFGSAVDPTCIEEEAERDALAQMQALEEADE